MPFLMAATISVRSLESLMVVVPKTLQPWKASFGGAFVMRGSNERSSSCSDFSRTVSTELGSPFAPIADQLETARANARPMTEIIRAGTTFPPQCMPNTGSSCERRLSLALPPIVSFNPLLDGCSFVQGGSLLRRWTGQRRGALWLAARWERTDPPETGSLPQTRPLPEGAHALPPRSHRPPCTPSAAGGRLGKYRCGRRGRSDYLTLASLFQQSLDSHVHPPHAVSLVPVELCPNDASIRQLNQRFTLKLAPTASRYNWRRRLKRRIFRPMAMTSIPVIGPRSLKPVTKRRYHAGVPTGLRTL